MASENLFQGDCPHCKGPFRYPKEAVGEVVLCPHCGTESPLGNRKAGSSIYENEFWLWINEKEDGPHTFHELQSKLDKAEINEHILFAKQNDPTWEPLSVIIKQLSYHYNPTVEAQEPKPEPIAPQKPTTKKCPYCAEQILIEAIKCKHCGSSLPSARASTEKHNPISVALASFCCISGLGQMMLGQVGKGLVILLATVVLSVITGGVAAFIMWPLMGVDAYMVAKRINSGKPVGAWDFFPAE